MSMRRDLIKQSWEGATGGWGVDNRRARRIDRKRRKREAEPEILEATTVDPVEAYYSRCLGCGERYCDGC